MKYSKAQERLIRQIAKQLQPKWVEASKELLKRGVSISPNAIRCRFARLAYEPELEIQDEIEEDFEELEEKAEKKDSDTKYRHLLKAHQRLLAEIDALRTIKSSKGSIKVSPKKKSGRSKSTAVAVWSDWHIEEEVQSDMVNGLNEFNLEIAHQRTAKLFRKTVDFIKMYQQDTDIDDMVIALLGDFISNDIHDELLETALLQPIDAILLAQKLISGGIDYILEHTDVNLTIPCHSGNHARTTQKRRVSTEAGHSLEYFMYWNLANQYKDNPRVKFLVPRSYLSYVEVHNYVIRFHHGHDIRYGGGIGGLMVPAYKAVSQWNKGRVANLDVFGHFHQTKDGGNFYCNGSLIGFSPYAISIKADYEPARQSFFLVHQELGRTINSPIHLQ